MASEIRANKQTNRAGLGTVTYTNTGIVVSGIVTATQFEGSLASTSGFLTSFMSRNTSRFDIFERSFFNVSISAPFFPIIIPGV